MTNDELLLKKRFEELARRSAARGCWTNTDFLNMAEQDILSRSDTAGTPYRLFGGFDSAERRIALFGSEELCGFDMPPPICCVEVSPTAPKFADTLTHRDFLGAVLSLGIDRSVVGDILVSDNKGYIFCLDSMGQYIADNLAQVRHTAVRCTLRGEPPSGVMPQPEEKELVAASERVDALVAAVYKLSRSESSELIAAGKVSINSRVTLSQSAEPSPGDIVSVRGAGRFEYSGPLRGTKSGRLRVSVKVY